MIIVGLSLICLESSMVMTMQPDISLLLLNLSESLNEPKLVAYLSKIMSFCRPLSKARNFRDIDCHLTETIPNYIAFKSLILPYIAAVIKQPEDTKAFALAVTSGVFEELGKSDSTMFNRIDRSILRDVLSLNMQWTKLFLEIPEENISYRDLAYIDAYPALQKLDLILTTIFLIASQNMIIDDRSVVHRLCLAARRYLKEVDTALFMNNPILVNRLRKPSKNISNAEMERLLELSS